MSIQSLLHLKAVYEPIPICIGYRPIYRLLADISVWPIRPLLIGIGYRYRPIWHLISVPNQYVFLYILCHKFDKKNLKKSPSKWDFGLLIEIFLKPLDTSYLDLLDCQKMKKNHSKFFISTYRYRLSVSADKQKIISVFYRYRPIRKLNLSVLIGRYEKKLIDRTLI